MTTTTSTKQVYCAGTGDTGNGTGGTGNGSGTGSGTVLVPVLIPVLLIGIRIAPHLHMLLYTCCTE